MVQNKTLKKTTINIKAEQITGVLKIKACKTTVLNTTVGKKTAQYIIVQSNTV